MRGPLGGGKPALPRTFSTKAGSFSTALMCPFSLSTICLGTLGGAISPYQAPHSAPLTPSSASVGSSGNAG